MKLMKWISFCLFFMFIDVFKMKQILFVIQKFDNSTQNLSNLSLFANKL